MRPEDIDKLFKERLGPSSPTPPADLWNRLQDRMEAEMPEKEAEKRKPAGYMWLSYSIAAAITLLLTVGIVFYNVKHNNVPFDGMAHDNSQVAEQPLVIADPAQEQTIAEATEPVAIPEVTEQPVAPAPIPDNTVAIPQNTVAKAEPKPATTKRNVLAAAPKKQKAAPIPSSHQVAKVEKPAIPAEAEKGSYYNTGEPVPATFASAGNSNLDAQPVEIIIKRAVAVQQAEEEAEPNGFEKKQKLAKNIFKQVRNLSNGERVELSELGINADKIALETQIGKQKISKVINL
ncbi:hypothetical protein [Pontibacter roseus]|uniref:hypothetical protein n=1 Tax=Pontibacter roseus TaxID=336989 RepID=UPI0003702714|nr:hypothetical protein [Pontibacter roseus]